jgi:uncharacterized membrane protein HdeD (DUF308 family)
MNSPTIAATKSNGATPVRTRSLTLVRRVIATGTLPVLVGCVGLLSLIITHASSAAFLSSMMLVCGILALIGAVSFEDGWQRVLDAVLGLATSVTGFIAMASPALAPITLVVVVTIWMIAGALVQFYVASRVVRERGLLCASGMLKLAFAGLLIFAGPLASLAMIALYVSLGLITWGVTSVQLGANANTR